MKNNFREEFFKRSWFLKRPWAFLLWAFVCSAIFTFLYIILKNYIDFSDLGKKVYAFAAFAISFYFISKKLEEK